MAISWTLETLWINRVKLFGTLIILTDTHVNNLIRLNKTQLQTKKKPILGRFGKELSFIK